MFKSLHLHNFRKHRDLKLEFSDGITVVRAGNEAGKTSLFEAITFALFGVRACRNADLTTWGEAEGSHKVRLVFVSGNTEYTVNRSARSAELTYEGGRVTGQTEVTRFCETVLNLKPNTGSKLMFSSQGAMRGILEDGGTKTAQMIEQLSDFGIIEKWINVLQEHFDTGRTVVYEQNVEQAKQLYRDADEALKALPHPDDIVKAERQKFETLISDGKTETADIEPRIEALKQQIAEANEVEAHKRELNAKLNAAESRLKTAEALLAVEVPQADETLPNKRHYENLLEQVKVIADYNQGKDYRPTEFFDGTKADLDAATETLNQQLETARSQALDIEAEIRKLKSQVSSDLACATCKRPWDDTAQREAQNAKLEAQIAKLETEGERVRQTVSELETQRHKLNAVASTRLPALPEDSQWQFEDHGKYPPQLVWRGETPSEIPKETLSAAQSAMLAEAAEIERFKNLKAQKEAAQLEAQNAKLEAEDLRLELQGLPKVRNVTALGLELQELGFKLHDLKRAMQDAQNKLDNWDRFIEPHYMQYAAAERKVSDYTKGLEDAKNALKEVKENNELLKYLRTVKPQVADKVWQTVCSTVSRYFSLMRGTESVVSKSDNGFEVDSEDVQSLSGSTLDILGIAVRIALTKTFVPDCRFLLLDEPFAACDAQRQSQVLGFIAASGFPQIVLVTHEDTTETVADHIITL